MDPARFRRNNVVKARLGRTHLRPGPATRMPHTHVTTGGIRLQGRSLCRATSATQRSSNDRCHRALRTGNRKRGTITSPTPRNKCARRSYPRSTAMSRNDHSERNRSTQPKLRHRCTAQQVNRIRPNVVGQHNNEGRSSSPIHRVNARQQQPDRLGVVQNTGRTLVRDRGQKISRRSKQTERRRADPTKSPAAALRNSCATPVLSPSQP